MTEAQRLAYRALQEALDRRDNGGRSALQVEPTGGSDARDAGKPTATHKSAS
ncbi:hypothetical protein [Actinopolymorpha pittospori]